MHELWEWPVLCSLQFCSVPRQHMRAAFQPLLCPLKYECNFLALFLGAPIIHKCIRRGFRLATKNLTKARSCYVVTADWNHTRDCRCSRVFCSISRSLSAGTLRLSLNAETVSFSNGVSGTPGWVTGMVLWQYCWLKSKETSNDSPRRLSRRVGRRDKAVPLQSTATLKSGADLAGMYKYFYCLFRNDFIRLQVLLNSLTPRELIFVQDYCILFFNLKYYICSLSWFKNEMP